MDIITIESIRSPATRADCVPRDGEAILGGGSWLFSEPQPDVTGLVDLTTLGWAPLTATRNGLSIAATCTFAELAGYVGPGDWLAAALFRQCCNALLGSFKVWNVATVGGNICLALPAGPMTSLAASLDADAVIWMPGGGERHLPVLELVTGVQATSLQPGEVLRSIEIPATTLRSRAGFRQLALSPLGRSGTLVIARIDAAGDFVVTVSAATVRPVQLRFDRVPTASELATSVHGIELWYDDAHGAPDWRAAMSALLAEELRTELANG